MFLPVYMHMGVQGGTVSGPPSQGVRWVVGTGLGRGGPCRRGNGSIQSRGARFRIFCYSANVVELMCGDSMHGSCVRIDTCVLSY